MRLMMGTGVFDAALERMVEVYENPLYRPVVSFSSGKDSTCVLELARIAARLANRLPIEVVMRDEEILLPGSFEYAERIANDPEIDFHWLVAHQPIVNVWNRYQPYFWVFDPSIPKENWVRQPPPNYEYIHEQNIQAVVAPHRFPPPVGGDTVQILGLRVDESILRRRGLASSGGYMTKANAFGVRSARPIYDWTDSDVWKAIHENKWDYNTAYDAMHKIGLPRKDMRIAPPTLTTASLRLLQLGAAQWPQWFARVHDRLEVKSAVLFGKRAVEPRREMGETFEECYKRVCIEEPREKAPWISERSTLVMNQVLFKHSRHSSQPFPDKATCVRCGTMNSWMRIGKHMYGGDPFGGKSGLPPIEPEFFRAGAGFWGGKPTW